MGNHRMHVGLLVASLVAPGLGAAAGLAPERGAPLGRWERGGREDDLTVQTTIQLSKDGVQVLFTWTEDGYTIKIDMQGEYSLSKDGNILYGVFRSASASGNKEPVGSDYLKKLEELFSGAPFSLRLRDNKGAAVVHDFRVPLRRPWLPQELAEVFSGRFNKTPENGK